MQTPAGWYVDPIGRAEWRYFDGHTWTSNVASQGRAWLDPLPAAPPAASAAATRDLAPPAPRDLAPPTPAAPRDLTPPTPTVPTPAGLTATTAGSSAAFRPGVLQTRAGKITAALVTGVVGLALLGSLTSRAANRAPDHPAKVPTTRATLVVTNRPAGSTTGSPASASTVRLAPVLTAAPTAVVESTSAPTTAALTTTPPSTVSRT